MLFVGGDTVAGSVQRLVVSVVCHIYQEVTSFLRQIGMLKAKIFVSSLRQEYRQCLWKNFNFSLTNTKIFNL